jgi:Fusaric acid resistance protein family
MTPAQPDKRSESVMSAVVDRHPMTFAGLPGSSWAFAIRIWLAILVALHVGFWLELDSASTAATTVAILALPTRGKALFRLIATVLGVIASISIVGIFAKTEALLLGAFAAWLGICVYIMGLRDGYRAYAAEPDTGKSPPRSNEGKAAWPSYSTTILSAKSYDPPLPFRNPELGGYLFFTVDG